MTTSTDIARRRTLYYIDMEQSVDFFEREGWLPAILADFLRDKIRQHQNLPIMADAPNVHWTAPKA